MFNPTSCEPQTITGAISSTEGASANVSSHFQAGGCATLPFAPKLTATVAGHASKLDGASLDVKIQSAGLGQANIHSVQLRLPEALPSRNETLNRACTEAQFNANPAACPPASVIGSAIVRTPQLSGPLAGPAILVSHGGAAFPDVEMVLQGEGVVLILDGKTDIKKERNGAEVTYSNFETVPDAPFTSFETKLPTGRYSIFAAYLPAKAKYDFCGQSLSMPTTIVGQNGAELKQTTKIAVTGCPKAKKAKKANAASRKRAKKASSTNRRSR